jgi:hypothetical protein
MIYQMSGNKAAKPPQLICSFFSRSTLPLRRASDCPEDALGCRRDYREAAALGMTSRLRDIAAVIALVSVLASAGIAQTSSNACGVSMGTYLPEFAASAAAG